MSNRSVVADRILDALGAAFDVAADIADVLADAADRVACTQTDQHGGPDEGK